MKPFGRAILESIQEVDHELLYLTLEGTYLPMAKEMGFKMCELPLRTGPTTETDVSSPRKTPGSVIHDLKQIEKRIEQLVNEGTITTIEGETLPLRI